MTKDKIELEIKALESQLAFKRELLKRGQEDLDKDAKAALAELKDSMTYVWTAKRTTVQGDGLSSIRHEGFYLVGEADEASVERINAYVDKFPEYWSKLKEANAWDSGHDHKPRLTKQTMSYSGLVLSDGHVIVHDNRNGWDVLHKIKDGRPYCLLTQKQWADFQEGKLP